MRRKWIHAGIALASALAIAAPLFAQTGGASAATPTISPSPPVPASVLTPGSASLTPGARGTPAPSSGTPGYGSNLYSIPKTTPLGMPVYPTPAAAGESSAVSPARRPMTASDCANGGWRGYAALQFQNQKACEVWLKQHAARASKAPTPPRSARGSRPGATQGEPRATTVTTTPGSAITPLLNPPAR